MHSMGVYVEYWSENRLHEMEILRLSKEEWERLFQYGASHSAFGVDVIDMTPLDVTNVSSVRILFRTFDFKEGLPAEYKNTMHYQPHMNEAKYCQCDCEECKLRLSKNCICLDCPCDLPTEDHQYGS